MDSDFARWMDRVAALAPEIELPTDAWRRYYVTNYEPETAVIEERARRRLIADAAEAVESIDADELERFAGQRRPAAPFATYYVTYPRLVRLGVDRMDAILAAVDDAIGHVDDTDPAKYEAAVYALLGAIRAAAPADDGD